MARYQYGNLTIRKRRKGPDVWQYRWVQNGRLVSRLIGTVERLPRRSDAERAVEHLRMRINATHPQVPFHQVTVGGLINRFMEEYAPKHCRKITRRIYHSFFRNHIRPRWERELVRNVRTMDVENWLEELPGSRPLKAHLRSLMHNLFNAAMRWELAEKNPVDLVRQSRKRMKEPRFLAPPEFKALLAELREPYQTMALVAVCLGLRRSELLALQWQDIDFVVLTLQVHRGVVEGEVNPTKTESSEGILPLDPTLAERLLEHKRRSPFSGPQDFVFAGETGKPRWGDSILADYLKPAAQRAGLTTIGWHTFRHTYSTWLHALGANPAVQKELLRHADIQTTMNVYTQAPIEDKREAARRVASVIWKM